MKKINLIFFVAIMLVSCIEAIAQDVEVFVASDCPHCDKMISYLKSNAISFRIYDLQENSVAEQDYFDFFGRGILPAVRIRGHGFRGYQPELLQEMLAKYDRPKPPVNEADNNFPSRTRTETLNAVIPNNNAIGEIKENYKNNYSRNSLLANEINKQEIQVRPTPYLLNNPPNVENNEIHSFANVDKVEQIQSPKLVTSKSLQKSDNNLSPSIIIIILGLWLTVFILGIGEKVVIFYDTSDFMISFAAVILPAIGFFTYSNGIKEGNQITSILGGVLGIIGGGFLLRNFYLSIKYNRNIFYGLIIGFFKVSVFWVVILIISGLNDSKSKNRSQNLATIFLLGWITSMTIKALINGPRVWGNKGWVSGINLSKRVTA